MSQGVIIDDARTEAIFAEAKLKISKEQREIHKHSDLWLSADDGLKIGLATAVREFVPPKGTQLFFLGPT